MQGVIVWLAGCIKNAEAKKYNVMLTVKADTQIKPVFMNLKAFNNNNEKFMLDGQFGYPINYKGVLGY